MWIFDGGIDGQSNETELVALFLILIIVPKKHRLTILLLFLVITVFIYLIQLYRPQYIIEPPSEGARWLDGLTTTIYTSVFVYLIIQVILKQYNAEKSKAEEGEKKQIELNADKDRFISVLGHDLRSPFTALLTLTESLKENIREYDINEIEEQVELLYKSSVGTYNLLEDLLLWATAQNNRIPFKPQPVSPFYACRNIIDILQPNATLKNIEINCKIEEDLNINGDPDMIKTVLRNLISNAIKFTPYGGTVNVRSELSGSKVRISVSDNGVGVKPENLKKLFDISTIYTTKGTEEEEGTGLGLLICRKFIEKHGEEIWVESEYGKGSKFHFTLPCIVNHNNSKDIKKVAGIDTETIKNMKLKVLIVDDDNISRM
jgi:signal transduction histidine kinase